MNFVDLTHPVSGRTIQPRVTLSNDPKEMPALQWRMGNGFQKSRLTEEDRPDVWSVEYTKIPQATKELMEAFEKDDAKIGGEAFNWYDPTIAGTRSVKYLQTSSYTMVPGEGSLYNVRMLLEEVI